MRAVLPAESLTAPRVIVVRDRCACGAELEVELRREGALALPKHRVSAVMTHLGAPCAAWQRGAVDFEWREGKLIVLFQLRADGSREALSG